MLTDYHFIRVIRYHAKSHMTRIAEERRERKRKKKEEKQREKNRTKVVYGDDNDAGDNENPVVMPQNMVNLDSKRKLASSD